MAFIERIDRRTRRGKVYQDDTNPDKFAIDATLAALHYETQPDSGVYDAEINCTPNRIDGPQLDGWTINENGWHYALGMPKTGLFTGQDGVVGFGGRQGQNWLKFRLNRVGYLRWSTRTWTPIGGDPTYNRANLSSEIHTLPIPTTGEELPIESIANWSDIWTTPNGGSVSVSWRVNGDQLKEEITVDHLARDFVGPLYPGNKAQRPDYYFALVFELDTSDIPQWIKNGIAQTLTDFDDDDGQSPIELRDEPDLEGISRLLAFLPVDDLIVRDPATGEELARMRLRKRIYNDGGVIRLVVGAQVSQLIDLSAGDLVFDPTVDAAAGASVDDAAEAMDGTMYLTGNYYDLRSSASFHTQYFGARMALAVPQGATIDVCYAQPNWRYADQPIALEIDFEAADNAAEMTTDASDITSRSLTGSTVTWTGTTTAGFQSSPSLVTPLQAVVNRASFASGNNVLLRLKDTKGTNVSTTIWCYDHAAAEGLKLHVEYTEGGGGVSGSLDITLGALTLVAAGHADIAGVLTKTLGALTLVATGTAEQAGRTGTLDITLGALTAAATGTVDITGTLDVTLGAATLVAAGTVTIDGTLDKTLGELTAAGTGTVDVVGALDVTLGALVAVGTGTLDIVGALDATLGALTLDGTGTAAHPGVNGSLNVTLGALVASGTGTVDVSGTLSATLGALTLAGAGEVDVTGSLDKTLGAMTLAGTGVLGSVVTGSLDATLGALLLSGTGEVDVAGSLDATLGAVTVAGTGEVAISGSLTATLGALTLEAEGAFFVIAIAAFGTVHRPNRVGAVLRPDRTGSVYRPNRTGAVESDRHGE